MSHFIRTYLYGLPVGSRNCFYRPLPRSRIIHLEFACRFANQENWRKRACIKRLDPAFAVYPTGVSVCQPACIVAKTCCTSLVIVTPAMKMIKELAGTKLDVHGT